MSNDHSKIIDPIAMNIIRTAFIDVMSKEDVDLDLHDDATDNLFRTLTKNGFTIVKTND